MNLLTRTTVPQRAFLASLTLILGACGGGGGGGGTPTPPASLTAPLAGAAIGGTAQVSWTLGPNPASMAILLSDDDGASFPNVLTAATPDNGSFSFDTTPFADGDTYRLRLIPTDSGGTELAAFGNVDSISIDNTEPVIELLSPDGGELVGGMVEITWTTTDLNPGTVAINLSTDSGVAFDTVITASAPDTGMFLWDSSGLPDDNVYRIELIPTDAAGNLGLADASSGDFELDNTIPTINLTAPAGGEVLSATTEITWTSMDTNIGTVELLASMDGGATFNETIVESTPDDGSFDWNTAMFPDGSMYQVRARAIDLAGNISEPSDSGNFTIENLVLVSPAVLRDINGNGTIEAGDQIFLRFNKSVQLNDPAGTGIVALGGMSSLGAGSTLASTTQGDVLILTLGTGPSVKARGTFTADQDMALFETGIDISDTLPADAIETAVGGLDAAPNGGVDLAPGFVESFTPASSLEGTSAAAGDLDGDGDIDVVVGEAAGEGGAIRLNDGTGDFSAQTQVLPGSSTLSVALADVDRDGDLDAIFGLEAAGNRVLTNDGAGNFSDSGQILGGAVDTNRVVPGDYDRDGDVDLAFANGGGALDVIFTNDGDGIFVGSANALGTEDSTGMAAGDIDNDGDLDLLAAYGPTGPANQVFLNNGSGLFTAGATVLLTNSRGVALGDLNGDGTLDAFFAINGQLQVALGDGSGGFAASGQFFSNNDNRDALLGDLDGDGDLDAIVPKFQDGDRQWLNDGDGMFMEFTQTLGGQSTRGAALGDFDGDGDFDFYAPAEFSGDDRAWSISLSGAYGPSVPTDSGAMLGDINSSHRDVRAADFDGDGDIDVFVGTSAAANAIFLNDGTGTLVNSGAPGSVQSTRHVFVDVDRDGDLDLLEGLTTLGLGGGGVRVLLQDNAGDFVSSGVTFGGAVEVTALVTGDLNRDGIEDVVFGSDAAGPRIFLGNSSGAFAQTAQTLASGPSADLALGDFDGDGIGDLLSAQAAGDQVLYLGVGNGDFTLPGTTLGTGPAEALRTADFNRDGNLDVLLVSSVAGATGQEQVLLGNGDGTFSTLAGFDGGDLAAVELVDWNGDGDLDALFGGTDGFAVWLGAGDGTFMDAGHTTVAESVSGLVAADLDRDGDPDAFTAVDSAPDRIWLSR